VTASRAGSPSGRTRAWAPKNKVEKRGVFFVAELVVFPATHSPRSHHVSPSKTPRYATKISKKPLQNTTATTPEKIQRGGPKIY
jgi:hypothetical protein